MKQVNLKAIALACLVLVAAACKKDPKPVANDLKADKTLIEVQPEGGAPTLSITANTAWTLSGTPDWIVLDKTSGSGNAEVKLTISPNASLTDIRTAKLKLEAVNGQSTPIEITVTQKLMPPALGVDKTAIATKAMGMEETLALTANIDWKWTIDAADADWISVDKPTGNGATAIKLAIKENKTNAARTAVVKLEPVSATVAAVSITINQPTILEWSKTYGGAGYETISKMIPTSDGGYLLVGYTNSDATGIIPTNRGGTDALIVKVRADGSNEWVKTYGGGLWDYFENIIEVSGGYIVVGSTEGSTSAGDDIPVGKGMTDGWVMKLDLSGNKIWSKTYGGNDYDGFETIVPTSDGYIIVGDAASNNNGDVPTTQGGYADVWVMKLDANGNKLSSKTYGGSGTDRVEDISVIPEGGYMVLASTNSDNSGDVPATNGGYEGWIIKLDANGDKLWSKTYGGTGTDSFYSIAPTNDGGYIAVGETNSNNSGDVPAGKGDVDAWVVKLDASGNKLWSQVYGGSAYEIGYNIVALSGGGYMVAGYTNSNNDGDVPAGKGDYDAWVFRLKADGTLDKSYTFGGSAYDAARCLTVVPGGFVFAGETRSTDIDVPGTQGGIDFWLVKLRE